MKKPVLEIRSLNKVFSGPNGPLRAIDDINFSVYPGEFLCIVGPSGCGKTTLLNLIGGLLRPTVGEINLSGKALKEPHKDIGMVFQND